MTKDERSDLLISHYTQVRQHREEVLPVFLTPILVFIREFNHCWIPRGPLQFRLLLRIGCLSMKSREPNIPCVPVDAQKKIADKHHCPWRYRLWKSRHRVPLTSTLRRKPSSFGGGWSQMDLARTRSRFKGTHLSVAGIRYFTSSRRQSSGSSRRIAPCVTSPRSEDCHAGTFLHSLAESFIARIASLVRVAEAQILVRHPFVGVLVHSRHQRRRS